MTRGIKRLIDLTVASLVLILFASLMASVALAIRLMMGRPIFFCQVRPGYNARPFNLYKFRTMREAYGPDGRPIDDAERLTRLGRFLRDESRRAPPALECDQGRYEPRRAAAPGDGVPAALFP